MEFEHVKDELSKQIELGIGPDGLRWKLKEWAEDNGRNVRVGGVVGVVVLVGVVVRNRNILKNNYQYYGRRRIENGEFDKCRFIGKGRRLTSG